MYAAFFIFDLKVEKKYRNHNETCKINMNEFTKLNIPRKL